MAKVNKHIFPYALILPAILYILIFQLYPLVENINFSFTNLNLLDINNFRYIGFENYIELFTRDKYFWNILCNSLLWVFGSAFLQVLISIPTSIALNEKIKGRAIYRGALMIPWVSPVIVAGIIWRWILDGEYGLLNYYLKSLNIITQNIIWLNHEKWVWFWLLFVSMWKGFAFSAVMLLAGLQGIPKELYEAAYIDGASRLKSIRCITLPFLKPVLLTTSFVLLTGAWSRFETIWALTEGGPGFTTNVLATYVYYNTFLFYEIGKGSAIATITLTIVLIFAIMYYKVSNRST